MTPQDRAYDVREQYESDIPEASEDEFWAFTPGDIPPVCPACPDGFGVLLGALGRLLHYRCRHCGIGFHHPAN